MQFQVKNLLDFLKEVTQKAGKTLDFTGLRDLAGDINTAIIEGRLEGLVFGERYIYENIYRQAKNAKKEEYIKLSRSHVDTIARYAGYKDFKGFENKDKTQITITEKDKLKLCEGVWKSYVRTNSGRSELLIAPLHIFEEKGLMIIEMKGERNVIYRSQLSLRGGCLRCLLDAEDKDDRQVYMVLNLGAAQEFTVLMGVFAAMSSGGLPIAGREVWIREEAEIRFEDLNHQKLNMEKESNQVHENILYYFKEREKNCWKGTLPSSFDIWDLRNPD